MKIENTNLSVADRVLAEMKKLTGPESYAVLYVNGRESGYTVMPVRAPLGVGPMGRIGVTFCENRNSDDIVVYVGTNGHNPGPIFNNHLTEEAYAGRTFFRSTEAKKDAAHAVAFLLRPCTGHLLIGGK